MTMGWPESIDPIRSEKSGGTGSPKAMLFFRAEGTFLRLSSSLLLSGF